MNKFFVKSLTATCGYDNWMLVIGWQLSDLESEIWFLSCFSTGLSSDPIVALFSDARRGIVLPIATEPIIELELRCFFWFCLLLLKRLNFNSRWLLKWKWLSEKANRDKLSAKELSRTQPSSVSNGRNWHKPVLAEKTEWVFSVLLVDFNVALGVWTYNFRLRYIIAPPTVRTNMIIPETIMFEAASMFPAHWTSAGLVDSCPSFSSRNSSTSSVSSSVGIRLMSLILTWFWGISDASGWIKFPHWSFCTL